MNKFKSLKTKLIVCTLSIVCLTVILNLLVGIISSYKGLTENVERDLKSIGKTVEICINSSLNNMKITAKSVAESDSIGKAGITRSEILQNLDLKKKEFGYKSLSLVNEDGTIISSDANLNGKNIANQAYFKKALSGQTYISAPTYDIDKKLCVIVCTPVSNHNNYKGVVMATYDPQVYSNIIKNIVIGKTGNVYMVDKSGTIIGTVRSKNVIQKKSVVSAVYKMMSAGKSGVLTYTYANAKRIAYCAPLPNTDGWEYCAVAPISEMTSSIWLTIIVLGLSSLLCIVLGIFFSLAVARSIANPITKVCGRLKLLANGDLHTEIVKVEAKDETGVLALSLNKTLISLREYIREITRVLHEVSQGNMLAKTNTVFEGDFVPIRNALASITKSLNGVLLEIDRSAEHVSNNSNQVSDGAMSLAQGSTEQASSVEELADTITNISDHVKQNAAYSSQTNESVGNVLSEIDISNNHMNEMVEAMSKINSSSGEIQKIIHSIEDITFQTNILALNASVEAARAGSAGKGFAVVADEVGNLAGKSAAAAKSSTQLIEQSMQEVENGKKVVDAAADSLHNVVESAQKIADTIEQMSQESQNQSQEIDKVTSSVDQISTVIQRNSAMAQESAAASKELSEQAQRMKGLINKFQIGSSD